MFLFFCNVLWHFCIVAYVVILDIFLLLQHFNNYLCSNLSIFKVRQPPGADGPAGRLDNVAASFGRGRPTLGQGHQRTVAPRPVGIRVRLHVGRQDVRAVDAPARLIGHATSH